MYISRSNSEHFCSAFLNYIAIAHTATVNLYYLIFYLNVACK